MRCTATSTRPVAVPTATAGRSAGRSTSARCTRCCSGCAGVEIIEDARLFAADPVTGERGEHVQRLAIDRNSLVFSYEHQVLVES